MIFRYWNSFPVFIQVAFIVALVSFSGAVLSVLFLYLSKLARQARLKTKAKLTDTIRGILLNEIIVPMATSTRETAMRSTVEKLRHLLNTRKYARKVLIIELINFRNVFSGEVSRAMHEIYVELGLQHRAINKLNDSNWTVVSSGLVELYRMDIQLDNDTLHKLIEHENRYVKEVARWYAIRQPEGDPLHILETIDEPILGWEELEMLKLFTDKKEFRQSSLKTLLRSDAEPTAMSIGIKLTAHYQLFEAIPELVALLDNEDLTIRKDAITALGALGNESVEPELVNRYEAQPEFLKTEMLEALGKIGSGRYLDFIEQELLTTDDFDIRRSASHAMVMQIHFSRVRIHRLLRTSAEQIQQLLKYYLNPITSRHA